MTIFKDIADSLDKLNDETVDLVKKALEEGEDPMKILEQGVIDGVQRCGDKFSKQEYFVPELIVAGELAQNCLKLIKPHLSIEKAPIKSTVVMATVQGDIHELGKNLVALMLELAGFQVIDLGVDVPPMTIIDKAIENDASVIALSSLMVTTMPAQKELMVYLKDRGLKELFKVIIGGAPTTQNWADRIGAEGWAEDAQQAVEVVTRLTSKGDEKR
jgi:methylmalonyl-CoA mutase cobalamin-binding domain/chain